MARRTVFPNGNEPQFERAFRAVADARLSGDYLEFGVFQGNSFVLAAHMATKYGLDMRLFAFDSFEGLPEGEGDRFHPGDYRCTQRGFERMIRKAGVDLDRVTCVPGWFEQTLTAETRERLALSRAAVVHIDCDLYSSTYSVLEFLDGLLPPGAVIIFDDWHAFANEAHPECHGEQGAFLDWRLKDAFTLLYDAPPTRAFVMVEPDERPLADKPAAPRHLDTRVRTADTTAPSGR
jgi:hypothetical protein